VIASVALTVRHLARVAYPTLRRAAPAKGDSNQEEHLPMRPVDRFPNLRLGVLAVCLALFGCGAWDTAAAQQATPAPAGDVIPPEECTAAPRPATFLADLIATPAAAPATPIASLPEGTPPDDQTRQEVTAAVRQIIACSNTGNVLRALALFGDEYLRRSLNPAGQLTAEAALNLVAPYATPLAIPANLFIRLVEIRDMRVLPDGRVAAVVVTVPPTGGLATDLFVFARTENGWIVDDAVSDFAPAQSAATPAA
jgi:hypothetical protein